MLLQSKDQREIQTRQIKVGSERVDICWGIFGFHSTPQSEC